MSDSFTNYNYTTHNLLRITFSTVCYFCVFLINMEIDLNELKLQKKLPNFMKKYVYWTKQ